MDFREADEWVEDYVAARRARARTLLAEITQQVKQALADADIDMDVFMVIPMAGEAICTFGTPGDPDDDLWERVSDIICLIVKEMVGLDRVRYREVTCASTADQPNRLTVELAAVAGGESR